MGTGDITRKLGTSAALTITLNSLASSSTLLAGRESTVITTAEPVTGYLLAGHIPVGTSPTAGTVIQIWLYVSEDDAGTLPDGFTGSDANKTVTSAGIRNVGLILGAVIDVDATTSDRVYPFAARLVLGDGPPKKWGAWIVHNTGVNLKSSGAVITYTPVYGNVAA